MGIPAALPLGDQNKAATAFYTRVKVLSQQELDRSFTWYTTKGLAIGMIDRAAIGMESQSWENVSHEYLPDTLPSNEYSTIHPTRHP